MNYSKMGISLVLFICLLSSRIINADLEYDGKLQIFLEHALDDSEQPQFTYRGEVSVKSLFSGTYIVEQEPLSVSQVAQLKELARENEIYRLKATVKTLDGRRTELFTFTPACSLVESNLSDMFYVNLDHVGNVVAVTLATPSPCSFTGEFPQQLHTFNTSVYISHMELGPVPDTASYIQKLEQEREAKERGETKDNRTFLAKYWMYIFPVVILFLVSSAGSQDGAGGGQ